MERCRGAKCKSRAFAQFNYCEAQAAGGYYCDADESASRNAEETLMTRCHGLPLVVAAFALLAASPAVAGSAWDDMRTSANDARSVEAVRAILTYNTHYV